MAVSFLSPSVPDEMASTILSVAELALPRLSHQPNDFLGRFRVIQATPIAFNRQHAGILGEIGSYTRQIYQPELVEQRAQSLLFPQNPITLERVVNHHPDTALTLGACLMCERS